MNREEKHEKIERLKDRLDNIKSDNVKDKIKRNKIRREIKELKMIMTTEDFESMMHNTSEIDISRCY